MSESTNSIFSDLIDSTTGTIGLITNTNNVSGAYLQYNNSVNNITWTTTVPSWNYDTYINPLKSISYSIFFSEDKNNTLSKNINGIRKNKFIFNCEYEGNRIQPYEYIMKLIKEKIKMSVKVKVSDILTICYTNLQFKEITNNLNFNSNCDFSTLKVKFKYDDILYENHKLSDKEQRTDKLKKIMSNE
jgi:hypothetical protein